MRKLPRHKVRTYNW